MELYANNVLTLAQSLIKDFPKSPEAKETKKIIDKLEVAIKMIKSEEKLHNIVDTIAFLVLANEKLAHFEHRLRHPEQKPQDDRTKVLTYARNVLKLGDNLMKDFPVVVETSEVLGIVVDIQILIEKIESEVEISNIVDTIAYLTLANEKLAQFEQRLRHPEQKPQDDKTKVLSYAKNVLKAAEANMKVYPTEKKAFEDIIKSIQFRIKLIESQVHLTNIVDTIAYLVLDNEKIADIARKHGNHIPPM